MADPKCSKCGHPYSKHDFSYNQERKIYCDDCPGGICK